MTTVIISNIYFDCNAYGADGELNQGRLSFGTSISGSLLSTFQDAATTLSFSPSISGTGVAGQAFTSSTLSFSFSLKTDSADITVEPLKDAWVAWSKIGYLDFTIDRTNAAGERPLDWTGDIYDILKLGNGVAVYGQNGVSLMKPHDITYDLNTIHKIGTKGKQAQININNAIHYFIDRTGDLYQLDNGLKNLGYSEFLSTLTAPVMSYDPANQYIYICDGTYGFVYSPLEDSLTKGPINVTGFGYRSGTSYVFSPAAITLPTVAFTTGVFDFGTRKEKTIFNLEISSDLDQTVQIAIMYRNSISGSFSTTPWATVTPRGIAYLPCYGIEFKFKFQVSTYTAFNLDMLKINGIIHGFSFVDSLRKER